MVNMKLLCYKTTTTTTTAISRNCTKKSWLLHPESDLSFKEQSVFISTHVSFLQFCIFIPIPVMDAILSPFFTSALSSWWSAPGQDLRGGMSSSLWSWAPLKKRPNSAWVTEAACLADIKLTVCPIPTVMFPAPSSRLSFWTPQSTHPTQTWTFLLWACNQNQAACNRGELFGLQTCCWGRRPCRVWIPFCGKRLAPWRRIQAQFWVEW